MVKRLKDFKIENRKARPTIAGQVLSMQFSNDEATKRIVMHSVKRVIHQHKDELNELAYK
ncbi:hypothetical protein ACNPQK_08915 [Acinetobacter guillouiae]|jgi:hypothetical protein|uniref:hypothetical protein n=1 Tax=Acinetobacter TaxID=469 RepID=UPI00141A690E|nr:MULTISPECIES: hypothetical protein [Acinetobacter]MCS4299196.1 hypothetical protein [Acinetobacter guillouiae]MCT9979336.1 hypothetical protein [Acinetobacter sp. I-MWF]MCW2252596.1 hypothetical protein [Acinetobacter sp. BIGb0204]MDI1224656.1 hypothetical protein [Acinetobacter sp.]NII36498.1 hypothetical protein [Acinetobacter sp. BIGb0196]